MYSCIRKLSSLLRTRYPAVKNGQRNHHCSTEILKKAETEIKPMHTTFQVGQDTHGFVCRDVQYIREYNMTAILLQHEKTKTEYLHIERDDPNNVFSIGFRTTPMNSKGTPHILEHTVLCGSEKYPVRDPFFKMLNRSLATFMNAMTGPDYTFYPFSSQNEVDYKNLQKVYLDAVFKPNLKRLDFLQEGWRLEHSVTNDKSSELTFKGVVYNEMKGAFSETSQLFGQKFINSILPQGTYGYVSGGDPLDIPTLTHEDLKEFHATYYHPSNARLYSYGNFPLEDHLKFCNEEYLSKYNYLDCSHSIVKPNERWSKPVDANIRCRFDQYGSPIEKQNQIAIGYVMSDITSIDETFLLLALSELMIMGPNSAFYKSLIEKNISGGYNSLTGYDHQFRDTLFLVGLKDLEKSKYEAVQNIVNATINEICEKGFERDHIESVLHGFELSIKHESPKFGLNLLFNLMPLWNHAGPILESLKVNKLLDKLKSHIAQPNYLQDAVEKYFVKNQHRLTMTMEPDPNFDSIFNEAEKKLLQSKIEALSDKEKEEIYNTGIELSKIQKEIQDLNVLPCLKINEVTLNKSKPLLDHTRSGPIPLQLCRANTNGVTYFKGVLSTAHLDTAERRVLPFFNYVASKFDTSSYNYRDFDKHVSKTTSGLGFANHYAEHLNRPGQFEQSVLISSYSLDENVPKMMEIWKEIFDNPIFKNTERMSMLLNTYVCSLTNGIVDSGHIYSMLASRSLVSTLDSYKENLGGLRHISNIQEVIKKHDVHDVRNWMENIADKVFRGENFRASFHYSESNENIEDHIHGFCEYLSRNAENKDLNEIPWTKAEKLTQQKKGLQVSMNIPVNFCAKAIPTVAYTHSDYAKLRVLSRFVTSKYLHPVVREQNGAYGGGASLTNEGVFNFYSYRDPNARKTLDVYDDCSKWVKENTKLIDEQNLFESKLSILQQMDQPIPEYMKGVDLFLYGLSHDMWKNQREQVLAVTKEDILEVSDKYLASQHYGKCVLGQGGNEKLEKDGEEWVKTSGPQE